MIAASQHAVEHVAEARTCGEHCAHAEVPSGDENRRREGGNQGKCSHHVGGDVRAEQKLDQRLKQLVRRLHDATAEQDAAVSVEALVASAVGQHRQHAIARGDQDREGEKNERADEIRHVGA